MKRPVTFKDILDGYQGVGPGFHLLRLSLALAVFFAHARFIVGGGNSLLTQLAPNIRWDTLFRPFDLAVLPMFFTLGGFLVMGSADRLRSTSTFLAFRGLRMVPALATEVVLSALVLGALFTRFPFATYFTSSALVRYCGNIVGWVTFTLPGVFYRNPLQAVNLSLWTVPPEYVCYAITAGLMTAGLLFRRRMMTVAMIVATIILAGLNGCTDFGVASTTFAGHTFVYYYFVGLFFFLWRERIPHSWFLFFVSCALSCLFLHLDHTVYIAPVFVTYCTVFIGLLRWPTINVISRGDYSYGIYLYHFPITQAVIAAWPGLQGHLAATSLTALFFTTLFAVFSWHVIERPTLMLKHKLPKRFSPAASKAMIPLPEHRVEPERLAPVPPTAIRPLAELWAEQQNNGDAIGIAGYSTPPG